MEEQIWFSFPLLQWVFTIRCTNSIRVHGSLLIGYSGIQTKLQHCITSISQLVSVKFFTPKYCKLNNTLTIYILVSCKCAISNSVYLYLSTCILLQYYSEECWFWRKKVHWFLIVLHYFMQFQDLSDWQAYHAFITQLTLRGIHDPSHMCKQASLGIILHSLHQQIHHIRLQEMKALFSLRLQTQNCDENMSGTCRN